MIFRSRFLETPYLDIKRVSFSNQFAQLADLDAGYFLVFDTGEGDVAGGDYGGGSGDTAEFAEAAGFGKGGLGGYVGFYWEVDGWDDDGRGWAIAKLVYEIASPHVRCVCELIILR